MQDIGEHTKVVQSITAASRAAGAVNGSEVDNVNFSEALVIVGAGPIDATHTIDFKVQEREDAGTWVDMAGAVFAQLGGTDDDTIKVGRIRLGVQRKANLRLVATHAGTGNGTSFGMIVLGDPAETPTNQVVVFSV